MENLPLVDLVFLFFIFVLFHFFLRNINDGFMLGTAFVCRRIFFCRGIRIVSKSLRMLCIEWNHTPGAGTHSQSGEMVLESATFLVENL
jgi:hypothetical protein